MSYVYSVMWLCTAGILWTKFRRMSRAVLPLALYFVFLGVWQLVNALWGGALDSYVWCIRGVSAGILVVCAIILLRERKESSSQEQKSEE